MNTLPRFYSSIPVSKILFSLALSFSALSSFAETKQAIFAGGCFWCMEPPYEKLEGVSSVISGYSGGKKANPTYKEVSRGQTSHYEVVQVNYDPNKISYQELVEIFWRQIDPSDASGSFVDRGLHYRSVIFFSNPKEKLIAEASKDALQNSVLFREKIKAKVATQILPAKAFYPAEDYHQDYYKKNPLRYKYYRSRSGRDDFINKHWGKVPPKSSSILNHLDNNYSKQARLDQLSSLQVKVTQEDGTERPFRNTYWDNKAEGIYVDIVSGEALFSSKDKFKSGTGWPSFTQPIQLSNVVEKKDTQFFVTRVEVRSKYGDSHLGHVFEDGPAPTGLRYCINSASLRFVPAKELQQQGYGQYAASFK